MRSGNTLHCSTRFPCGAGLNSCTITEHLPNREVEVDHIQLFCPEFFYRFHMTSYPPYLVDQTKETPALLCCDKTILRELNYMAPRHVSEKHNCSRLLPGIPLGFCLQRQIKVMNWANDRQKTNIHSSSDTDD